MHKLSLLAAATLALGLSACDTSAASSSGRSGAELYETCAPCHGPNAAGNAEIEAPAISGMQQWYVENQLAGFQAGYRGSHFDDIAGMRMRPMALSLNQEGDIKAVAAYVASLPELVPRTTVQGDVAKGQASYGVCASCHGADGRGNEALEAPSLVDKNDWYLATQLRHFKSGVRGAAAGDTRGAQMTGMAATLADDQAIADVVAYIGTLR